MGCSLDVTAVLYRRMPLTRLGYLTATAGAMDAHYLSGLDVGGPDANGERLVASGWVASNCTSTWNGKQIRVDRVNGRSVESILARDLAAQDREPAEAVSAWVQRDVVTFWYQGGLFDPGLISTPAIARYRIVGGRAVRETPIALTRAGFIHEWLSLPDAGAVRWGEPEAAALRKAVAAALENHVFRFAQIGRCGGTPPVWEVAVRSGESPKLYVFRIGGSRAAGLRMLAITGNLTRSCIPENTASSLESVGTELPW
jgi:hypothetical protein